MKQYRYSSCISRSVIFFLIVQNFSRNSLFLCFCHCLSLLFLLLLLLPCSVIFPLCSFLIFRPLFLRVVHIFYLFHSFICFASSLFMFLPSFVFFFFFFPLSALPTGLFPLIVLIFFFYIDFPLSWVIILFPLPCLSSITVSKGSEWPPGKGK